MGARHDEDGQRGPDLDIQPGAHLGEYEVLRKLAVGGMAEIYLARASGTAGFEKLMVLKRILPKYAEDRAFVTMFLDEARLAATLRHANIANVFDVGAKDGSYFFAMEYIHGQDARALRLHARRRHQPIPIEIAVAVAFGTAAALEYAHDKAGPRGPLNLVHRDVSPSNILISYDGAVKLVDFGIARASSRTAKTQTGLLKGKAPYMSPEQCRGQVLDRRSDLFSLGIVLYELTTGERPFHGDSDFETMNQIVSTTAALPSTVVADYPKPLEVIVMRLLTRKRERRYQNAGELLSDLEHLIADSRLFLSDLVVAKFMRELFAEQIAATEAETRIAVSIRQPTEPPRRLIEPTAAEEWSRGVSPQAFSDATRAYPDGVARALVDAAIVTPPTGYHVQVFTPEPTAAPAIPPKVAPVIPPKVAPVEDDLAIPVEAPPGAVENPFDSFESTGVRMTFVADPEHLAGAKPFKVRVDDPRIAVRTAPHGHPIAFSGSAEAARAKGKRTTTGPFEIVLPFDPIDARGAEILDAVDAAAPTNEPAAARTTRRIPALLEAAFTSEGNDLERAVAALDLAMSETPDANGHRVLRHHREAMIRVFEKFLGDPAGRLALARPLEELASVPLSPRAAFLLSRLDGLATIDELLDVSGMPRLEALRYLCQLFLRGVLVLA